MALQVGELFAAMNLDSKGFDKGLGEVQSKTNDAMGSISASISKGLLNFELLKAGFNIAKDCAGALVDLGKNAVSAYADYEQLVGGVETLFKSAAGTVMASAEQAFQTVGLSANAYMETVTSFSASMISSLGGDTEKAARLSDQAMQDMADNANKMGTDISSLQYAYQGFAKQNYTMLDNLKIGYGGTKSEMERLLSDGEKLTGKKYNIDSFADITEAIHAIQTQMDITGTTAKEAEHTITGSVNATKAAVQNLIAGFGNAESDFDKLIDDVMTSLQNVVRNITPVISRIVASFPTIIEGVAASFGEMLEAGLLDSVSSLASTLPSSFVQVMTIAMSAIKAVLPSLIHGVIDNIPSIIENAGTLAGDMADALFSSIGIAGSEIVSRLPELLPSILVGIGNLLAGVAAGILSGLQSISDTLLNGGDVFGDLARNMKIAFGIDLDLSETTQGVQEAVQEAEPTITQSLGDLFESTKQTLTNGKIGDDKGATDAAKEQIDSTVGGMMDEIEKWRQAKINSLGDLSADELSVQIDEINKQADEMGTALQQAQTDADAWMDTYSEAPTKVVQEHAGELDDTLATIGEIETELATLNEQLTPEEGTTSPGQAIVDSLGNNLDTQGLIANFQAIGTTIFDAIISGLTTAETAGTSLIDAIAGTISGALNSISESDFPETLSSLATSIINVLSKALSSAATLSSSLLTGILDVIEGALNLITSDSFTTGVANLITALGEALVNGVTTISATGTSFVDAIADFISSALSTLTSDEFKSGLANIGTALLTAIVEAIKAVGSGGASIITAIGDMLASFFNEGEFSNLAIDLTSLGSAVINGIVAALSAVGDSAGQILTAIGTALSNINWTNVATDLTTLATGILTSITTALDGADFSGVMTSIGDGLGATIGGLATAAAAIAGEIIRVLCLPDTWDGIGDATLVIGQKLSEGVGSILIGIAQGLAESLGIPVPSVEEMKQTYSDTFDQVFSDPSSIIDADKNGGFFRDFFSNAFGSTDPQDVEVPIEPTFTMGGGAGRGGNGSFSEGVGRSDITQSVVDEITGEGGVLDVEVPVNITPTSSTGEDSSLPTFTATVEDVGVDVTGGVTEETKTAIEAAVQNDLASLDIATGVNMTLTLTSSNGGEIGQQIGTAIATGIGDMAALCASEAKWLALNAKSGLQSVSAKTSGMNFAQGFIDGMSAKLSKVIEKAKELGKAACDGLKESIEEGSPSKITKQSGKYFGEGFELGILSQINRVGEAASQMGKVAADMVTVRPLNSFAAFAGDGISGGYQPIDYDALASAMDNRTQIVNIDGQKVAQVNGENTAKVQNARTRAISLRYGG